MSELQLIMLRSATRFKDVYGLDVRSGAFHKYARQAISEPLQGWAAELDGDFVALYPLAGRLRFRLNQQDIDIGPSTAADFQRGETHRLSLRNADGQGLSWEYAPPVIDPPLAIDPTPFVEEEHFDFGLFVYNVLTEPGRRDRIMGFNQSGESDD